MKAIKNKFEKRRIVELSYKHKLSHIGSCITSLDIIKDIYDVKEDEDRFILSAGHAGLALYVVLEQREKDVDAEVLLTMFGVHPNRWLRYDIDCSTGSLGHGLGIAVGMALADKTRSVYCLVSDGEMAEGSIWEALRVASENKLKNLKISLNMNGYSGLGEVDKAELLRRIAGFVGEDLPFAVYETECSLP